mmetsp:Transcript_104528/g.325962  ORF Transcript_104528/g.325962 Transcript_104528/m.325962 type:complete len:229 (-) Transcript_104528:67-753(-)
MPPCVDAPAVVNVLNMDVFSLEHHQCTRERVGVGHEDDVPLRLGRLPDVLLDPDHETPLGALQRLRPRGLLAEELQATSGEERVHELDVQPPRHVRQVPRGPVGESVLRHEGVPDLAQLLVHDHRQAQRLRHLRGRLHAPAVGRGGHGHEARPLVDLGQLLRHAARQEDAGLRQRRVVRPLAAVLRGEVVTVHVIHPLAVPHDDQCLLEGGRPQRPAQPAARTGRSSD